MEKIVHAVLLHRGVPKPDSGEIDSLKGGEFVRLCFVEDHKLQRTSILIMHGKIVLIIKDDF
jgi:hypothetical protein